jgi:hypothetical protein
MDRHFFAVFYHLGISRSLCIDLSGVAQEEHRARQLIGLCS